MHEYKVGDTVMIKHIVADGRHNYHGWSFISDMEQFAGQITKIIKVVEVRDYMSSKYDKTISMFKLDVDNNRWIYAPDWLEPIETRKADSSLIMDCFA